ncbi:hypothetical protein CO614_04050 [Lysobacteraceae bacterium NML120232]|nr:hypothetical protein CO614_04050 [Xanthomonadaceae bacterium NML120232]
MTNPSRTARIFFSWQSDSPSDSNSGAIRNALKVAKQAIEAKHPDFAIVLDEATRDTSGSPNIANKILEKIDAADIYIADITTVTSQRAKRPCANPNVLIELGYAIALVGWDRTILLFNDAIGKFPKDLPFDITQNRVSKYSFASPSPDKKKSATDLASLLQMAIQAVIDKNPKTPVQLRGLTPEKIHHQRDVENLTWLLSQLHIPTLDDHIAGLPRYLRDKIFWFWERYKGVVTNSLFHVYDPTLDATISKLFNAWKTTLAFPERYHDAPSGDSYVFANPGDAPLNHEQEVDWQKIERATTDMSTALHELLDRVRSAYVEVDITDTNAKAWKEYHDFHKEWNDRHGE